MPDAPAVPIATTARVGAGVSYAVEAMEGFGVMRAAHLAGTPTLELRAISNLVTNPDRSQWQIESALNALQDAITRLVPCLQ
jgi:futalosine hydrolase